MQCGLVFTFLEVSFAGMPSMEYKATLASVADPDPNVLGLPDSDPLVRGYGSALNR